MVPVGGNVFESKPELLAPAGSQRRDGEVNCLSIWAGGLKHMQGNILGLGDLARLGFRVCHRDLEEELIRALGPAHVAIFDHPYFAVTGADGVSRPRVENGHRRGLTTVFGPVTVTRKAYRAVPGITAAHTAADAGTACPSASDALRLCGYNHPDLMLLDVALLAASGLQMTLPPWLAAIDFTITGRVPRLVVRTNDWSILMVSNGKRCR